MKKIWMPVILLAAATSGRAAEKRAPDIIVFFRAINENVRIVRFAETQAGHMLAAAGITVAWRTGSPDYHGRAEVIEAVLTDQPDESAHRGALAFAMLGQQYGPRIEIFYNRLQVYGRDSEVPPILAHVLVHEITHVLEGVNRHSETGIMKAHWDTMDWRTMRHSFLPFADEDLRLIHAWIKRHDEAPVAETSISGNGPSASTTRFQD